MKQVLIICDTLYQIMLAIQMKETILQDDDVDIWVSDHSVGAENISENLSHYASFRNVKYLETREIVYSKGILTKIRNLILFGIGIGFKIDLPSYDEVIFHGLTLPVYGIFNFYRRRKHNLIWSSFEEGILSYDTDIPTGKTVKIIEKTRALFGLDTISELIEKYYCVFPGLKNCNGKWKIVRIPTFSENYETISKLLALVFSYSNTVIEEDYIFFASASDWDGTSYGEREAIKKLAKMLGKDNLLVKKHPRDASGFLNEQDISVMDSDGVPWEIIQLCSDIGNKTLITVDSGSFLSISAIMRSSVKGVFIYPIFADKRNTIPSYTERDKGIESVLGRLKDMGVCDNISVAKDYNSIL